MTKKDFFRILIKVFALNAVVFSVFSMFSLFSYISFDDWHSLIKIIISILLLFSLFVLLIRKPDLVIDLLKLEKGFDEDIIQFENFNAKNILKLSSIIIGGLLIINNIPTFLNDTFSATKSMGIAHIFSYNSNNNFYWIASFIKIILGYFLVTKNEFISNFFKEKKSQEKN